MATRNRASKGTGRRRSGVMVFVTFAIVIAVVVLAVHRPASDSDRPEPGFITVATVVTDVLNVRDRPALDANVVDALAEGSEVTITGSTSNGFVPVQYSAGIGWMSEQYLQIGGAALAEVNQPQVGVPNVSAEEPASSGSQDEAVTSASEVSGDASGPENVARENDWALPDDTAQDPLTDDASVEVVDEFTEETQTEVAVGDQTQADAEVNDESAGEHWIEVDRLNHLVKLRVGDRVVGTFSAKLGRDPSTDGFYSTAVGTYFVFSMSDDLSSTPFADGVYLDNWVGFDPERKNGFHSPVLGSDGVENPQQNPTTLGCVRMDAESADAVYAFAYIGMRVEIHD